MKQENKAAEEAKKPEATEPETAAETKETKETTENAAEPKAADVDWQAKCAELNDAHIRLMADFDNYRKRNIKEKADLIRNAAEQVITDLLPVVDNFERALQSMDGTEDVKAVRQGVELIYNQLINMLSAQGVTVIETAGLPLDTDLHDAITTIPAPAEELKGKIVDCVKKGYKLHDKVIRHSQVVVGE